MRGRIHRSVRSCFALLFLAALCAPRAARAIDLVDGRLHVNGYLEAQVRTIARDFQASDDWDLTQWYNVLDVEIEADLAPDGWGPFSMVSGFARIEARYDCVWTRGCGMFSSADAYGDRADHLPGRLSDGRRAGFRSSGTLFNGDTRRFAGIPRDRLGFEYSRPPLALPPPDGANGLRGAREASRFFDIEGIDTLFDTAGVDNVFGNADDPAPFIFDEVLRNCLFGFRRVRGRENGVGHQVLGPWNPGCKVEPTARLSDKPHPLSATDLNPVVLGPGNGGFGALPLRPVPQVNYEASAPKHVAKGIYLPNSRYAKLLRDDVFDNADQTFRQAELEWNHGASQQDEKELKELYLDMEFFDSRLWIRAGKQTIVWGKTELFRNQDQFNPQDVALASLPSLEESRIALWALRGVWSFYDVGPLEDVRLELAGNYDQFEPTDLGRCGEPYSPLPVCDKTYGLFIHGLTGLAVAGEVRPDNPWSDLEGIEGGARLEFRWGRFSFALTDFYGFGDLPYQDQLFVYSRNVDPATGRPRHGLSTGSCTTGTEEACLQPVDDDPTTPLPDNDALRFHSVNQQVFAMICATSVGLSPDLDPTACGQTVFNSHRDAITGVLVPDALLLSVPTVSGLASNLVVGNEASHILAAAGLTGGVAIPRVPLNADPCDGFLPGPCDTTDPLLQPNAFYQAGGAFPTMNQLLTVEQMASLGCGPFYGTNCEAAGLDLMNAEASAVVQSWPGFEGAGGTDWDTTDPDVIQPGTLGFEGGPACTRFEGGEIRILPGCRGPTYQDGTEIGGQAVTGSAWDPRVDGDPSGLLHPFFDPASPFFQGVASGFPQEFRTELSALSFNALMALVALSTADDLDGDGVVDPTVADFDPSDPFRADGCSFSRTHLCSNVQSLYQVTGLQRNTVRAGGGTRFGRRDFVWHGGSPLALRYDKRNVLGFSTDFAEDRTKSSWGLEFTWVEGVTFADYDARDRTTTAQTFNTTISIDRPTFINFLNANRTFFLNSQWFVQWVEGYRESFPSDGPWNVLATFTIQTGFFRDRFQSNMTFVYDFGSNSGAWLPSVTYRYTENFSVTFGAGIFAGRMASRDMPLSPTSMANRAGQHAYDDFVENGLSVVRERDELFLRVRYTY